MKVELSIGAVLVLSFLVALRLVLRSGANPNRALDVIDRFFQSFNNGRKKD